MLTRNGRKILDHNLTCLIREEAIMPTVLEELVLDIHEYPDLVTQQILQHRLFKELVLGLLRIMDRNTPMNPRLAGNASYVLGALIDSEDGRDKVLRILKMPAHLEETQNCIPNLGQLLEIYDLESMTNASGTASLLVQNEEYREWALEQPAIDWLIHVMAKSLLEGDMWVASNCALTLARLCMEPKGRQKIWSHKDGEHFVVVRLIMSLGNDNEGRGMNAAFALAYLMEDEAGMRSIAYMREILDLVLGLINMLKSVNDDCRKNAVFCLKKMSNWPEGQERINDDPDIDHLLKLLCNLMTCGVEDLGKMAAVTLKNLAERREGYMLQKDHSQVKSICRHVLSQMSISPAYRHDAFEALKAVLIPKPEPPVINVIDAFTVEATWRPVEAKSGCPVWYELYNGENVIYTGDALSFTETGLKEKTDYSYSVRAMTDDNEESFASEVTVIQTHKAVSSPPINLRAVQVTASKVKIVWEKPEKLMGSLKGYYVQEIGSSIHYEPVYMYHIASNLNADSEYSFQVCAVTNKGRGQMSVLTVKTLRQDYNAPSRPTLLVISSHEIVVTWYPPVKPSGRINGYEVLCNGKSIYFGPQKRCIASQLLPNTKYKFTCIAWTSEGRTESEPATKKTGSGNKGEAGEVPKFRNKEELFKWLDSQEVADLEEAAEEYGLLMNEDDDDEPRSPRKSKMNSNRQPAPPPPRVREPMPPPSRQPRHAPTKRDDQAMRASPGVRKHEASPTRQPKPPSRNRPPAQTHPKTKSTDKAEANEDLARKRMERREAEKKKRERLLAKKKTKEQEKEEKRLEAEKAEEEDKEPEDEVVNEPADDSLEKEDHHHGGLEEEGDEVHE